MASSASVGLTSIAIRVNPSRGGEEFGEGSNKMQSQKTESKEKKYKKRRFQRFCVHVGVGVHAVVLVSSCSGRGTELCSPPAVFIRDCWHHYIPDTTTRGVAVLN